MTISRASGVSLFAALALHALIVGKIASRPQVVADAGAETVPLDLTFVQLEPPPLAEPSPSSVTEPTAPPVTEPSSTTAAQARPTARVEAATTPLPDAPPLVGASENNEGVLSPRVGAPAASAPVAAGRIDFGLRPGSFSDGPPAPTQTGPVGPRVEHSAREAPVDAARILRAATDKHDVALGVGFGGPVAAAGRSALSSPHAPLGGRGRYEVRTNAAGQIVAVRALEGDAAWQAFAATLQAVLASRTLRVPEGARGVVVVVALEARQQEVAGRGSSVMNFDVANLAAGPSRVVTARVESERVL